MEVRTSGPAGRADAAENRACLDILPILHGDAGQVSVARCDPVAVVDLDHLAVAAGPFGRDDMARCRGADQRAVLVAQIDPGMHSRAAEKRIDPDAKT